MSWTDPKTWQPNEVLTASELNTQVRDNLRDLHRRVTVADTAPEDPEVGDLWVNTAED